MMRKRARRLPDRRALLAFAALLAVGAAPALGGDTPIDPDLSTEGLRRIGPFHLRPYLLLKDAGYDDNVRFESPQAEGDTTATTGAGFQGLLLFGNRGGLRFDEELDYVAFGEETALNHWNGSARARGVLLLKRAVVSFEDRFESLRQRPGGEVDQRVRQESNALTAAARTRREGRFALKTSARRERISFSDDTGGDVPVARRLNRDEEALSLGADVRILPKTVLILQGVAERVTFDDRTEGRDSRAHSVLAGFRFDPNASVKGEFLAGQTRLRAFDRPEADFEGTVGSGHLACRMGTGRLKTTFARDLVFSVLADNLYYVSTSWTAAWEQFFSKRLSVEILYGRGLNHYPQEMDLGAPVPRRGIRDDRLTTRSLALRYRIGNQLALQVAAHRLERDSTDDLVDRERNAYALGTTYSF